MMMKLFDVKITTFSTMKHWGLAQKQSSTSVLDGGDLSTCFCQRKTLSPFLSCMRLGRHKYSSGQDGEEKISKCICLSALPAVTS
jgi:hypothetical protein